MSKWFEFRRKDEYCAADWWIRIGTEMGKEIHVWKRASFPWITVQGWVNGSRRFWL